MKWLYVTLVSHSDKPTENYHLTLHFISALQNILVLAHCCYFTFLVDYDILSCSIPILSDYSRDTIGINTSAITRPPVEKQMYSTVALLGAFVFCFFVFCVWFFCMSHKRQNSANRSTRAQCKYKVLLAVDKIPRLKHLVKRRRPPESLL